MKKQIIKSVVQAVVIAILIVACIVGTIYAKRYSRNLTAIFCGVGDNADVEAGEFSSKLGDNLVQKIGDDSTLLLRNEDETLPLEANAKVNVFGTSSADKNWIHAGTGSGGGVIDPAYTQTLMTSLKAAGFKVNEELEDYYANTLPKLDRDKYELNEGFGLSYKNKVNSFNVKQWSDVAIVALSRYAGETIAEIPLNPKGEGKTYLELTNEESELLTYIKSELGFEKIIVVINAANAMNLGFLEREEYGIGACIWTGFTGQSGASAIGQILSGALSPSAKTSDTFVYTTAYDPTWVNNRNVNVNDSNYSATDNMVEAEGIYYGYKWYETADAEGFFDSKKSSYGTRSGYGAFVQYPFGYGLSYTNFEWKVVDVSLPNNSKLALDSEISITVEVTNKGSVAGKDVVELYFTPPYTPGGIEKAAVNLLDFAKTPVLYPANEANDTDKPNKAQVTLTFTAYELASFDCWDLNDNGKTSWELDDGDYVISLRTDSHNVANDIMATGSNAEITYKVDSTLVFDKDPAGEGDIDAHLTGDKAYAGVSVDGIGVGLERTNYLSRADSFANYEDTVKTRTEGPNRNQEKIQTARTWLNDTYETTSAPTTGSTSTDHKLVMIKDGEDENGDDILKSATYAQLNGEWGEAEPVYNKSFIHALASDYNAAAWAELISQMSFTELTQLVEWGGFQTYAIASIGKVRNIDYDGPAGFNLSAMRGTFGNGDPDKAAAVEKLWTVWPGESMIGCSWNKNLLLEMGLFMGMEAQNTNVSGWYAPGMNLHRTAYTNRNFEYYSEDAVLAGNLGANVILGAKMNNLYCYMKHFVCCEYGCNPGDTNTWLTEQSLRENYMRVFEIAVKEGGANAIMTAFNNVGPVWAGANYATCTQILRDEWGFKGTLLTDICSFASGCVPGKFNQQQGIRAGQDVWLNHTTSMFGNLSESDPTTVNCLQRAAKNIVWTSVDTYNFASTYDRTNLDVIFGDNGETSQMYAIELSVRVAPTVFAWWVPVAITLEVLVLAGCAVWAFFIVKPFIFKKKAKASEAETSSEE